MKFLSLIISICIVTVIGSYAEAKYSHIHWSFRAFRVFRSFPTAECRLIFLSKEIGIQTSANGDLNRKFGASLVRVTCCFHKFVIAKPYSLSPPYVLSCLSPFHEFLYQKEHTPK